MGLPTYILDKFFKKLHEYKKGLGQDKRRACPCVRPLNLPMEINFLFAHVLLLQEFIVSNFDMCHKHYQKLSPNMASLLANEVACIMNCWRCQWTQQHCKNICIDDWTAELAIIASNEHCYICIINPFIFMVNQKMLGLKCHLVTCRHSLNSRIKTLKSASKFHKK